MPCGFTTRDVILDLIQVERRPPTWRWQAAARHDDLLPGLWEWQADASHEGAILARELMRIEQEARARWPTSDALTAAGAARWKRQP